LPGNDYVGQVLCTPVPIETGQNAVTLQLEDYHKPGGFV